MPVYKDKERGTWYVVMRYTALDGSRKMTTKEVFEHKEMQKIMNTCSLIKNPIAYP